MPAMFILALAPAIGPLIIRDPPRGPMPAENHSLSQPHANMDSRMFPDMAVKELRIDGDTLYVLVRNEGGVAAEGPMKILARAEGNGVRSAAAPLRLSTLAPGEKRWVAVRGFAVRSAATREGPVFALQDASFVTAEVKPRQAVPNKLDRSGRGSERVVPEFNDANNSLGASGSRIVRGKPE